MLRNFFIVLTSPFLWPTGSSCLRGKHGDAPGGDYFGKLRVFLFRVNVKCLMGNCSEFFYIDIN